MNKRYLLCPIILILFFITGYTQTDIYDSSGPILPEQAAYDVHFYDLELSIDPDKKHIAGKLSLEAEVVSPIDWLVLNLDTLLKIESITEKEGNGKNAQRKFERKIGQVWIDLQGKRKPGSDLKFEITYNGHPRIAPNPPWNGGFTWEKTPSGAHWIATTCQQEGPDIWWPSKDHVSDKPDSMALHIRVPEPLVVATNGRFLSKERHLDSTATYHWFISTPISAYNVALNIAPYRTIETTFKSIAGDQFPMVFYVLPEDYNKGQQLFPEMQDHLHFFEKYFGPYPFRADKYGVAQTPHLGMEHQTIIAYGANFRNHSMTGFDAGFDALHQHELAHEWWGNLVTNSDWKDMWLHEGFGSYTQPLYVEYRNGKKEYHAYMSRMRRFGNRAAIAPRDSKTAKEIYQAPIYSKGAWVLHTLRYLIGDEPFFEALRRMAYPSPEMEKVKDGSQVHFATTDDFIAICESISKKDLNWFFEVYVRQPKLPVLYSKIENGELSLKWQSPENLPFPMPVDVQFGEKVRRVEIPKEGVVLKIPKGVKPVVDPDGWGLFSIGRR